MTFLENCYNYLFKRQTIVPKHVANCPAENGTVGEHASISDNQAQLCKHKYVYSVSHSNYVMYFLVGTRQLHISQILVWLVDTVTVYQDVI